MFKLSLIFSKGAMSRGVRRTIFGSVEDPEIRTSIYKEVVIETTPVGSGQPSGADEVCRVSFNDSIWGNSWDFPSNILAIGKHNGLVCCGKIPSSQKWTTSLSACRDIKRHKGRITGLSWWEDYVVCTSSLDCSIKLWDCSSSVAESVTRKTSHPVFSMSRQPKRDSVVATGHTRCIALLDLRMADGWLPESQLPVQSNVLSLCWSPLSCFSLVSSGSTGEILIWDVRRPQHPLMNLDYQNLLVGGVNTGAFPPLHHERVLPKLAHTAPSPHPFTSPSPEDEQKENERKLWAMMRQESQKMKKTVVLNTPPSRALPVKRKLQRLGSHNSSRKVNSSPLDGLRTRREVGGGMGGGGGLEASLLAMDRLLTTKPKKVRKVVTSSSPPPSAPVCIDLDGSEGEGCRKEPLTPPSAEEKGNEI